MGGIVIIASLGQGENISYLRYEVDCLAVEASTVSELSLDLHVVEDIRDIPHLPPCPGRPAHLTD